MNVMTKLHLSFVLCITPLFSLAQSDTVLIGNSPDADYVSLLGFINSLQNQTLSDTLLARVLPGVYSADYEANDIAGAPVVIEGFYEEPDSVVIRQSGIDFDLHDVEDIIFKNIFFKGQTDYVVNLIDFSYGGKATFINCKFNVVDSLYDGAIDFSFSDILRMENCEVLNGEVSNNTGSIILKNSIFRGDVHLSGANDCSNNTFYKLAYLSGGEHYGNTYHDQVRLRYHNTDFFENTCFDDLRCSFEDNIRIYKNVIHGVTSLNGGVNYSVFNNHFFGDLETLYMDFPSLNVVSNNFSPGARLTCVSSTIQLIANNNFSQSIFFINSSPENQSGIIKNNNYWPGIGQYGTDRYHIDPQYYSIDSLLPSNPLLVGQAAYFGNFIIEDDILGIQRETRATIGANEYCMDTDSLTIDCGQRVNTRLCSFPPDADLTVEPSEYVGNFTNDFPNVFPPESMMFYLTDENSGMVDSLFITVSPMEISPILPIMGTSCGIPVTLLECPLQNEVGGSSFDISWEPSASVYEDPPYEWNAVATETTTFSYSLEHEYCGVFQDSILVYVSDNPLAYGEVDDFVSSGEVAFTNLSQCENSVMWDFGDGTFSSQENPTHNYFEPGIYYWTLTASNANFSDSYTSVVQIINTVGTSNTDKSELLIYPNPTKDLANISNLQFNSTYELQVYDNKGNLVLSFHEQTPSSEGIITMNLLGLPDGLYHVILRSPRDTYSANFIKQ